MAISTSPPTPTQDRLRIAVGVPGNVTDDQLRLAAQMGCSGVVVAGAAIPYDNGWAYDDLARLRERIEGAGLRVEAMQHTPLDRFDQIRLGLPGRDRELEAFQNTLRNMGRAGLSALGYNWRPNRLYRTGKVAGRGGALVTAFDASKVTDTSLSFGREYGAEELWETYEYFLRRVIPVAEEAGVRLALHPDDPPGVTIGGVTRIMSSFEGFKRASEIVDSPSWGLLFCIGCWTEMGGSDYAIRGLRYFGERGKLVYVHFRDITGPADNFRECLPGEGDLDLTAAMRTLKEVGFTGFVIDDHAPQLVGDSGWNPLGRVYQTGYLMGLLRAVEDLT